jgi:hypothetical protein
MGHPLLTDDLVASIRQLRHECRLSEGGTGMCHYVTDALEHDHGWRRESGTYLSKGGEVICGDGHYWNCLPDGSLLDPTSDQFAEGFDIRVLAPDDPEQSRYRWAWTQDYHPDFPTGGYPGPYDYDLQKQLQAERGRFWWLPLGPEDINAQIYIFRSQFYDGLQASPGIRALDDEPSLQELDSLTRGRFGIFLPPFEDPLPQLV